MILTATFIILIIVAIYAWHCHRLIDHAESRARRAWADHEQVVASKDEALTHLRGIVDAVVAENKALGEIADLERTKHAIVLAELERHEAEHTCLPSLDGIRGTNADPMPPEDYLQVVAQPAAVVPIRKGRAK